MVDPFIVKLFFNNILHGQLTVSDYIQIKYNHESKIFIVFNCIGTCSAELLIIFSNNIFIRIKMSMT